MDDLVARIWAYTGMQTSDKKPKLALTAWDEYLKAKHARPEPAEPVAEPGREGGT